jgi:hypothetical protein
MREYGCVLKGWQNFKKINYRIFRNKIYILFFTRYLPKTLLCFILIPNFTSDLHLVSSSRYLLCAFFSEVAIRRKTKFYVKSVGFNLMRLVYELGYSKKQYEKVLVRFKFLTAASMKMTVFWIAAPCSLVEVCRCFRDACYLHYQGHEHNYPEDSHLRKMSFFILCEFRMPDLMPLYQL